MTNCTFRMLATWRNEVASVPGSHTIVVKASQNRSDWAVTSGAWMHGYHIDWSERIAVPAASVPA
jgi:hypothetical protein